MRKARQIIGALLGMGVIIPLCLAVPAAASTNSQAQAVGTPLSASPDVTEGTIFLTHATAYGWTTHGDNAQLTIESSGQTSFYLTATSDPYFYKIHVANSSHCIEAEGNGNTEVIATDCQEGNNYQKWEAFYYNGGCTLQDKANSKLATVYNNANGKPVWEQAGIQSGSWQTWSSRLWSGC